MTTIRRTTIGNLALAIFVAFLLQVVMAAGGLIGDAHAANNLYLSDKSLSKVGENGVRVKVTLWPLTGLDFSAKWSLELDLPGLKVSLKDHLQFVGDSVYEYAYDQGTLHVYATVYANVYKMLLTLSYVAPPSVAFGSDWYVDFTRYEWDTTAKTVYLTGIFKPPEGPSGPAPTPPTTVPTDTGTVRIDPEKDEAVL